MLKSSSLEGLRFLWIGLTCLVLGACNGTGYLADRANDFADCFVLTAGIGPEVSASVEATDLAHVMVGGGLHAEAGLIGRRFGGASVASLGLPFVPFIESGILHGRYSFVEVEGAWRTQDVEDECYLIHALGVGHTNPKSELWSSLDVEAAVMVGVGLRAGLRPGELVDFLAGLFGFDPIGDDRRMASTESGTDPSLSQTNL